MEEQTPKERILKACWDKIESQKREEEKTLTLKQQQFCDYYLQTGNATESAKKSGYSDKTAAVIGCELLKKPNIKKYIDENREKLHNESIAKADEILRFWSDVLRDVNMPVNFRLKASEFLGKGLNLFDGEQGKREQQQGKLKEIVDALNGFIKRECQGENGNDN